MAADEPPTRRESGQLAAFERAASEALAKLVALEGPPTDRQFELEAEARELLRIFANWKTDPPLGEARAHTIERVLDLHRSVESMIASQRST